MQVLRTLILATLVSWAETAPTNSKYVVHEERKSELRGWAKRGRLEGSAILPMRIGLTQANLERGHDLLMEVSHPESPKYGQWWTSDQVHRMFSPTEEAVNAVRDWLITAGIDWSRIVHTDNKGWLAFDASVEQAERLLLAEFYEHHQEHSSKIRVGTDKYHVPEHLRAHIDYITPGLKLTSAVKRTVKRAMKPRAARTPPLGKSLDSENPFKDVPWGWKPPVASNLPPEVQNCGRNITPPCYRGLYTIPQPTSSVPGHSLGLYEQGDYFAKEDLDLFFSKYAPYIPNGTYPLPALIDGTKYGTDINDTDLNQGESNVDIDIATSLIYPQTVTLYQVDDEIYSVEEVNTANLYNNFLDALDGSYCTYTAYGETGNDPDIDPVYPDPSPGGYKGKLQCGVYTPTKVISSSYNQAEADLPAKYTKRQCNEFLKLGLQGHSILVSSGDFGVASFPFDGADNGCLGSDGTVFNPQYPSNCPYITSVGATMLYPSQTVLDPESVLQVQLTKANLTSAGGFSNYFPQPSYQKAAIANYFERYDPKYPYYSELETDPDTVQGLYNRMGRAYPDVSANGANVLAFTNGIESHWYGASFAAPLFASVLTLLNQERARVGKGSIGFVNPVLYANPWVLNDITNGTNEGCGTEGFTSGKGWDPVTGLGTPNYPRMKELFLSLP